MSYKVISIVIDEFSSRADEMEGVIIYDYGVVDTYIIKDFYQQDGFGKGDFQGEFDQIISQGSEYKYEVSEYWDKENYTLTSQGNVSKINGYLYDEIEVEVTTGLTAYITEDPEHGDIVIESFLNQLDDPSQSQVIAIEYPSSLSEFSNGEFYKTIEDFLENYTAPDDEIFFIGLNASFGLDGSILDGMSDLIVDLFNEDLIVVQAAPNANASIEEINWSEVYPNVINVGAWNNEYDGEFAGTTSDSMPTVDIYADGFVQSSIWDNDYQNFGTSFASPVVLAEIHNWFINNIIPKYESGEYSYSPQINLPNNVYENALDEVLSFISTDLEYRISDVDTYADPIKVLTDDIEDGILEPQTIPYDIPRLVPAIELEDIQLFSYDNILTDFDLDLFPSLEIAEDLNDVDEFMTLIESYVDKDIFNISATESEYFHVGENDQVYLNGPENKISLINGDNASLNLMSGNSLIFSKGDNLTVNDMGSGGVIYFELDDNSNINLNTSSSGLTLLIGDKVFNEYSSLELVGNKLYINDIETGVSVNFKDTTSFIEIQDIYGNSNQLRALPIENPVNDLSVAPDNSQDFIVNSYNAIDVESEITIFDEQSFVSNSLEPVEVNIQLDIEKDEPLFDVSDNFAVDDDIFINDEDLNELVNQDNNLISNNSAQMVDLNSQEFKLNFSGDDTISIDELSDGAEAVLNIEDYDRKFEEIMDEVLFASGLDSFFWDDDIDLISET